MFYGCSGLTSLDLSGFKTDKVTDMSYMFSGCSGLTTLDLSGFKTDKVTSMSYMFSRCSGLTTIYAGDGWSTKKVTSGSNMFDKCTSLVGGQGSVYSEKRTGYTYARIDGGTKAPGYFTYKEAQQGVKGDVNADGKVDMADAQALINAIIKGTSEVAADLNGDGKVDIADMIILLRLMEKK